MIYNFSWYVLSFYHCLQQYTCPHIRLSGVITCPSWYLGLFSTWSFCTFVIPLVVILIITRRFMYLCTLIVDVSYSSRKYFQAPEEATTRKMCRAEHYQALSSHVTDLGPTILQASSLSSMWSSLDACMTHSYHQLLSLMV